MTPAVLSRTESPALAEQGHTPLSTDSVGPALHVPHDSVGPALHVPHDSVRPALHVPHDSVRPALHVSRTQPHTRFVY